VAGTTGEGAALVSVRLVGVGSARHCDGETQKVRALLWPLFDWSAWAQPATVEAETTCERPALASVSSVRVGISRYCVGGHVR
jgi:hypothetical protein